MEKKRVIVTGGGASGLMAAIAAAENGAAVTILEQNEKPGKKICATGNGKCNFTNIQVPSDAYRSENPGFEQAVLNQFPVEDTVKFFTRLGIYPVNKNGGYLYPHSGQAASVAEVLCMEARNLGVKIKTNQKVQRVFKEQDIWKVQVEGWIYEGEAVILSNGSKASAISGSDGSGYELAAALGHRLIEPLPALTALKCRNTGFSDWCQHFIAWTQVSKKSNGQGMCSTRNLRTHQTCFCVECIRINLFQSITTVIVVAVTGRRAEALLADAVFLHSQKNFHLVIFCSFVKLFKTLL